MLRKISFRDYPHFQKLKANAQSDKSLGLKKLISDRERSAFMCVEESGLLYEYSKSLISLESLREMISMARWSGLDDAIRQMLTGSLINETEYRAVLHTALRKEPGDKLILDGVDIVSEVHRVREEMRAFAKRVHSGAVRGATGKQFTHVINIGIGGSDLGPRMVCHALGSSQSRMQARFLSNVDGEAAHLVLADCPPESTLVLIVSKTFTTQETMQNARIVKQWLADHLGEEGATRHLAAVTTGVAEAGSFGIDEDRVFGFWDWVGGRFSLWSAVGLSIVLALGEEVFDQLLTGARVADEHLANAPFEKNIPVLMALTGIWNRNFLGLATHAVVPYADRLQYFTAYLQQLDMESNGKGHDRKGHELEGDSGPIIWGSVGTNAQHAYFQLLHQGSTVVPVDFIGVCRLPLSNAESHDMLMANYIAQQEALLQGRTREEAYEEMISRGMSPIEATRIAPYRSFEGGRPSAAIMLEELNPFQLGLLVAMYEHKVFVQGYLWGIYSFDQWGVELGKKLAAPILTEIQDSNGVADHDDSTQRIMSFYLKKRGLFRKE